MWGGLQGLVNLMNLRRTGWKSNLGVHGSHGSSLTLLCRLQSFPGSGDGTLLQHVLDWPGKFRSD